MNRSLYKVQSTYLEYHSVCPLVRIGTPSPASESVTHGTKGGGHTRLRVMGGVVPIRMTAEKALQYVSSVWGAQLPNLQGQILQSMLD
jgi:hypothetical protein